MKTVQSLSLPHHANTTNKSGAIGIDQLDLLLDDIVDPKCVPIHT